MKSNYIKSTIALVSVLLALSSCKKFLDQEVPGQLAEQTFYQTDQDAMQATTAIYDLMTAHYNTSWASMYMVKTMPSDESNASGSGPGDQEGYQRLDDFTYDSNNDKILGAWRICYGTIYRANKVINNVKPETDLRKRLIAEAKFLRAYNYMDLVSMWGDVPLVLNDVLPSQYTSTPRAKKRRCIYPDCKGSAGSHSRPTHEK